MAVEPSSEFSPAEAAVLARYFTNLDRPVFALRNLPEVVKGALFSRYSRTEKSLRRVLLEEFINEPDSGFEGLTGNPMDSDDQGAIRHAEAIYELLRVGYGHESVAAAIRAGGAWRWGGGNGKTGARRSAWSVGSTPRGR